MKNSITLLLTAILVTACHENEDSSGAQFGAKAATQFDSSLEEPLKNLAIAIRDGDYDTFTNLAGTAIPLDLELPDKKTLLTVTALNGNVEMTQFLISRGLEVNTEDYRGMTPLHYAALYGRNDVIPVLLNNGAIINYLESSGMTPLHCAAIGDSIETLGLLVTNGANLAIRAQFGKTAHDLAILNEKEKNADELVRLKSLKIAPKKEIVVSETLELRSAYMDLNELRVCLYDFYSNAGADYPTYTLKALIDMGVVHQYSQDFIERYALKYRGFSSKDPDDTIVIEGYIKEHGLKVTKGQLLQNPLKAQDAAPEPPPAAAVLESSETMNPKPKSEAPADSGGR